MARATRTLLSLELPQKSERWNARHGVAFLQLQAAGFIIDLVGEQQGLSRPSTLATSRNTESELWSSAKLRAMRPLSER